MSTTAIAGIDYSSSYAPVNKNSGIDSPFSDGGIIEQKEDKPVWGACEERDVMIDPETGEPVYRDVYEKEQREENFPTVCYLA